MWTNENIGLVVLIMFLSAFAIYVIRKNKKDANRSTSGGGKKQTGGKQVEK